jgi:conjugative coupling factor TraD (TOL family)
MKHGATEGLLRPPVELWSAATAGSAAIAAVAAPWALMLSPTLGLAAGAIAASFTVYRARDGYRILRYTTGLTRYKISSIAPHKLPQSTERLFMGYGFYWTQRHTQRLIDARRPEAQAFLAPSHIGQITTKSVRRLVKTSGRLPAFGVVSDALLAPRWWNPIADIPDLGGSALLHGVEPDEVPISLSQKHRVGHLLVIGTTRVGKTRLLEILVTQDIRDKRVVIVIDPKGDAELMMRVYAEAARAGRLDQFYLFHLGYPEISARYNGIGNFARITEVANRATNALPNSGNSAAFKEFAWRFTNLVAQAQVALGQVPTYELLLRDITDIEPLFIRYAEYMLDKMGPPTWESQVQRVEAAVAAGAKNFPIPRALQDRTPRLIAIVHVLKELQLPEPVLQGLATAVRYERSFFEKIVASLGPFLEKLTTGAVGKLISPDYFDANDKRPIFDWMQVIRQGGIVYVGLDALSDPVVASAIGNTMLADLVSVGGKLYKSGLDPHHPDGKIILPTVDCHFDEVNELIGPEFIPMVNKMGGAGFRISAYTQTIPDIEARVGDKAKAQQILGNFNHLVMLRVKSSETAKFFTDQLPKVDVTQLTMVSGVTDTAADQGTVDFVSRNEDRVSTQQVETLTPADIMAQPQGQAFALLEGNRLSHIRMPLPVSAADDEFLPESLRAIGEAMRARYHTSENWAAENDWLAHLPVGLVDTTPLPAMAAAQDPALQAGTPTEPEVAAATAVESEPPSEEARA